MRYNFVTRYTTEPFKGEKNNGQYLVDPTGYIPAKRQIENMLFAGRTLDQSRLEDYDFTKGDKLEYREEFDLRSPDADFTTADKLMQNIAGRAAESKADTGSDNPSGDGASTSDGGNGSDGKSE